MNLELVKKILHAGFAVGMQSVDFDLWARLRHKKWLWEVDDAEGLELLAKIEALPLAMPHGPSRTRENMPPTWVEKLISPALYAPTETPKAAPAAPAKKFNFPAFGKVHR